jgi:membrane protein
MSMMASALAFHLFLLLLPLAYVLVAGLDFLRTASPGAPGLLARHAGVSGLVADSVDQAVRASQQGRWLALAFGILATLYATSGVVTVLQRAHALVWQVPPPRGRQSVPLVLGVLGAVVLVMITTGAAASARHASPGVGLVATLAAGAMYFGVALAGAWALPRPPIPVRAMMPGALMFAIGLQVFHVAVAYYFVPKAARTSAAYGSLGVALVVLASLSLLGLLVVGAAEFNAVLWERRGARQESERVSL